MFVHLADAVTKGFNKVLLRTVATDVVVFAVAAAARINVQELWVALVQLRASGIYRCIRLLDLLAHSEVA